MGKHVDHKLYRESLINGAVKAGAKYDLGGITNQTIAEMSGQSEPYIYRYFFDRDDLIRKAFFSCDENFFSELTKNLPILSDKSLPPRLRFHKYMNVSWDYMVQDFDYCKFYIRYYYSNANTEEFREEHRAIGQKFFSKISNYFDPLINTDVVMHHLFSIVIWNVMDIAVGITKDSEKNRTELFDQILRYILQYIPKNRQGWYL